MEKPSEKLHPNRSESEQDMEMTPVVFAPPAYGSPDPNTGAGQLVPVDETHLDLADDYGKDEIAAGAVEGSGAAKSDDGKPAQSATRAEWDEYARAQGIDPDEYSSKEDLIAALS